MSDWKTEFKEIEVGTGRKVCDGNDVAVLSLGHVGNYAVEATRELSAKGISAAHYDLRFAKPLDAQMLHEVFKKFSKIITIEDGCLTGGFGSGIIEFMSDNGYFAQVQRLGIPDRFVDHGSQKELHLECGYYKDDIVQAATKLIGVNETAAAS